MTTPFGGKWDAGRIRDMFIAARVPELPARAYEQFAAYLDLLLKWNARLNLTAIRAPEAVVRRHFVECAAVAGHIPPGTQTLLDLGSGAGFPGLPIAISRPEIVVTLAESQAKKAAFLREAVRTLHISAEVYAGRAEAMPAARAFDAVAMRAVEKMAEVISLSVTRARRFLLVMASERNVPEFRAAAPELAWQPPIRLPGLDKGVLLIGRRSESFHVEQS